MKKNLLILFLLLCAKVGIAQSIAREWNEEVLNGIRNDFARPTVHARNLFHTSMAMYDVWAMFNDTADTFFLGKELGGFRCEFDGFETSLSASEAQEMAMSYAVYRIMKHRFADSPGAEEIMTSIDELMDELGYLKSITSKNYSNGDPAALGNYLADQIITFGLQDGANEVNDYENLFYEPVNDPLNMDVSGNPRMEFPNNWQPLKIDNYVDQSGNTIPGGQPPFLGPEWGAVVPFSLTEDDADIFSRDGFDYYVYHNPGDPSFIEDGLGIDDPYKWGFATVLSWSSHLDPTDGVIVDISPNTIGNIDIADFPESFAEYRDFYIFDTGGDASKGRELNPATGEAYAEELVLRGDFTRVLAEFWADGPDSETPPGHWFTILNYVNDNPALEKRYRGVGPEIDDLEWDVKAYFILGGTMHDVAIAAWGIKGYYDYVRPVSAIRYMGDQGQSTNESAQDYNPHGLPLVPGKIEVVEEGDPLAGAFNENLGKMKVYSWRGPDYIADPNDDEAGVDWILAEDWWPYQRPSFVTPPFAGYVSGHSAYSRAASEVLTLLTGDAYFPGGIGTFDIPADEFLQFEKGPSQPFQLQWATYRDASDQTSLSRIWGGIHPPIDDIRGRIIGERIGIDAFNFAESYFTAAIAKEGRLFPNPASESFSLLFDTEKKLQVSISDVQGRRLFTQTAVFDTNNLMDIDVAGIRQGVYFVLLEESDEIIWTEKLIKN